MKKITKEDLQNGKMKEILKDFDGYSRIKREDLDKLPH